MRKLLLGLVGGIVLLVVAVYGALQVPSVQDTVLARAVNAVIGVAGVDLSDPDVLTVIFCGTGGPFPDPERAGPCTLVAAGGHVFLIDSGTGGAQRLMQLRVPMGDLDGVLYTHLHSDHIAGLGDVAMNSWASGREDPLVLYGPPGVAALARGTFDAFGIDSKSRIDHHGEAIFALPGQSLEPRVVDVPGRDASVTLIEEGDLKITAFRVTHVPLADAYGYRIDYRGRSVVFSGDTVKDENMVRFGSGADVMVHEAMGMINIHTIIGALSENGQSDRAKILTDASEVHTSPVDAALVANEADAGLLIYNHVVPPMPAAVMEQIFMRGVAEIRPNGVLLGYDGLRIRLPVDTTTIDVDAL